MKSSSDKNAVSIKAQELCKKIENKYTKNDISLTITVSIGIALYQEHGSCYHELFNHADTALYVSKEKGRNRYTIYNSTMK